MRDPGHGGLLVYICMKSSRSCFLLGQICLSHIGHALWMMYIIVRKLFRRWMWALAACMEALLSPNRVEAEVEVVNNGISLL